MVWSKHLNTRNHRHQEQAKAGLEWIGYAHVDLVFRSENRWNGSHLEVQMTIDARRLVRLRPGIRITEQVGS